MKPGNTHPKMATKYCPVAQSVERQTVNLDVVGSSPTGAAKVEFVGVTRDLKLNQPPEVPVM